MMRRSITIVVLALVATASLVGGCSSSEQASGWSGENERFMEALKKAGGDRSKLSPEHQKMFDEMEKSSGPRGRTGAPGATSPGG
jgi:hypothetical protein